MKVVFVEAPSPSTAVAVFVHQDKQFTDAARGHDEANDGALSRAIGSVRFSGEKGQTAIVLAPTAGAQQIVVVGAGPLDAFDHLAVENAAGAAYHAVKLSGATTLTVDVRGLSPDQAAHAALGARLAAYAFDKYQTTRKPERIPSIETVEIATGEVAAAEAAYARLGALAEAVEFARDLVSEPANVLHPEEFALRCRRLSSKGLEVEVLGEEALAEIGMHMLLGVGQGSRRQSQVVIMRWNGAGDDSAPIAFVGKGVCFDTGGISIKPAEGMEDMKWDMGGAAAVAGAMLALAGRKAKVNAVGILGLVENMPDGNAQRPGDVVTSLSGQTVEVINTDAEGRLVLGDALWYCQDRFKPRFMVDLATLTGAMIIALGLDYAGLFSNDDALADKLLAASKATGENLWRMPLPPQYEKQLESPIADLKNIGGRPAGSITAALFLQKFVNGVPWAHLDIAPTAWKKPSTNPTIPEGAVGFGVRLLDRLAVDYEV